MTGLHGLRYWVRTNFGFKGGTMRKTRIPTAYSIAVSVSRLAALSGTFFAVVGILLIARIPWVER